MLNQYTWRRSACGWAQILSIALLMHPVLQPGSAQAAGQETRKERKEQKNGQVWLLKQTGLAMGQYDTYVSEHGLRAQNVKNHVIIVASAPDWKICAYNYESKSMWRVALKDFNPLASTQRFMTIAANVPQFSAMKIPFNAPHTQNGLEGTKYFTDARWKLEQQRLFSRDQRTEQEPSEIYYFGTPEIVRAAQPRAIIASIFNTPKINLMPLEFRYKKLSGSMRYVLVTASARRAVPPRDWLKVPDAREFRMVKSMQEVNMDTHAQQGVNQMLDNLSGSR